MAEQTEQTKKYFFTYEESDENGAGPKELLQKMLDDPELPGIKHVIVGYWGECYEQSPQAIIDGIVANKDRFAHLDSLYIGEMDYEECEVSWIIQGDYSAIYQALPNLKSLTIKGAQDLVLGKDISHVGLQKLEIICGGLDVKVIEAVAGANLPALETLILYLGVDDYGYNAQLSDLEKLLVPGKFPALKYLGLVDSEEQDEIAGLILKSGVMKQLETLDLSYGVLTDKGGELLLDYIKEPRTLKKLVIEHHYLTDDMVKKVSGLPLEVHLEDQQDWDDDYKYPMLTE